MSPPSEAFQSSVPVGCAVRDGYDVLEEEHHRDVQYIIGNWL